MTPERQLEHFKMMASNKTYRANFSWGHTALRRALLPDFDLRFCIRCLQTHTGLKCDHK